MRKLLILAAILIGLPAFAGSRNIDITKVGARESNKDNAAVIQKAIDKVSSLGGGTVVVPAGKFVTGPLELKSGVELHLEMGATLLGYPDTTAYRKAHIVADGKKSKDSGLIFAYQQENIAVTGLGTIDGQGGHVAFKTKVDPGNRPMIFLFRDCKNIVVKDVTLQNSAHDGIDIESSDVVVTNCMFDCEDDAIGLKALPEKLCENITVSNCVTATNCNAIKLGTASVGGWKNVSISNITVRRASEDNFRRWQTKLTGITAPVTVISGIAIEVVDGGIAENINVSNVAMTDVQTPIFIRMARRSESDHPDGSHMRGITISNVTAESQSMMSCSITGVPGLYPENIYLSNIDITAPGGGTAEDALIVVPEAEDSYPENRKLGQVLPAGGVFIRHVNNVYINNMKFHFRKPDARPLIITDDCKNIVDGNNMLE